MSKKIQEVKPKITHIMADGTICDDISKKTIPIDSGAYEIIAAVIIKQLKKERDKIQEKKNNK